MRIGSICSGVDGLGLGLEWAGLGAPVWQCETDRHASTVLAAHWPGVPNHGDITTIDWSKVEPVDVLCGGPPCQPISSAGKGAGTKDERWLWADAIRALGELRPRFAIFENPAALLNGGDDDEDADRDLGWWGVDEPAVDPRWFGAILGALADVGFDAWWGVLRASDVGAPHKRARLFVVAADTRCAGTGRDRGTPSRAEEPAGRSAPGHADALVARRAASSYPDCERQPGGPFGNGGPIESPEANDAHRDDAGRRGRSAPDTNGQAGRSSGNAKPGDGETADGGRRSTQLGGCDSAPADADRQRCEGSQPEPWRDLGGDDWGKYTAAVRRWEPIHGPAPNPVDRRGQLNPALSEWMMGLPAGWITDQPIPRTAQLRCAGNTVVPHCAAIVGRWLIDRFGLAYPDQPSPDRATLTVQ